MPLLELKGVCSAYGKVEVLHGISMTIETAEIVTLLGANGAGKTTTLHTISGLKTPIKGEIWFDQCPIHNLSPEEIVRKGLAHVPEGRRVFPGLTVRENILLGASNRKGLKRSVMENDADQMFDIFPEIKPFENAYGWTLSGGQQQMLAVARGLMAKPKLLLLDEPSLGLAPVIVQNLFKAIKNIHALGTTILLVEQNANMALSVASRGYVLETGIVKVFGTTKELLGNEQVRMAYLGGAH
jgi:branched-chain amino acid transport system ATP-binding protein